MEVSERNITWVIKFLLLEMPSYLSDRLYKQFQFENNFFSENLKVYSISVSSADVKKSDVIYCISQCCR